MTPLQPSSKQKAKDDGQAIESPGQCELQRHADDGAQPHADAETCRSQSVFHLRQERGVGSGDQQVNRGVVEAAQNPLGGGNRPHIVGSREREHRYEADDVDQDWRDFDPFRLDRNCYDRDGADEPQTDADHMHGTIGDDLSVVVVPVDLPRISFG